MPFPARGQNVKLGKGSLLLDFFDQSGNATGLQFIGNATAAGLTWDITKAELYSSTEQSGGLVASNITRAGLTWNATVNEYTLRNLQSFLRASEADANQTSGSSQMKALDDVAVDRYYEIGARRVTSVTVLKGSIPLVLNTDYELNSEYGIVHILPGGSVVDGDDLVVEFDRPALTIKKLQIGTQAEQIARLLYLADDVNTSGAAAKDRLELWRVDVAPEGELQFISDEYGSFQLSMAVLIDANHPGEPYGKLDRVIA